ncbi:MAG: 3-hydroxyacyl-CoA dehydrogenase family protein [Bacteroidota bacterium]|nr:3-hydroxyacyl-CoA dehydrogenase family protein [Bacteroidota bacterium]
MQIIVLADALQREALSNGIFSADVVWVANEEEFLQYKNANAFIDLEFINTPGRIAFLAQLLPKPVIINSIIDTLAETNLSFARINAWNSFLNSELIEASANNDELKKTVQDIFGLFNKKLEWLPDVPGFVTPRVISMIINEAYFALSENVSTIEEVDTAMKLGTAYPYGPFEWGNKIGLQNIVTLLKKLSKKQPRYIPCELLVQETDKAI